MNEPSNQRRTLVAVALVLLLVFIAGLWFLRPLALNLVSGVTSTATSANSGAAGTVTTGGTASAPNGTIDTKLLSEAQKIINDNYVDQSALKSPDLTYGAIQGMVQALGDTGHSRFLSPSDLTQEQSVTTGEFQGIGAEVQMENDRVVIVTPIDGSPAQKAGLMPGDIMLQVDGNSVEGQTLDQVVSKVLGPAGTKVTITILRPSTNKTFDVTITRAKIELHNVTWHQLPGTTIAHVRVAEFSRGVSADLEKALQQIQSQKLTGIVFDLRNNPGGLLDEAVNTASFFLKNGNVLLVRDAKGKISDVPVQPQSTNVTMPMVVLINQGSASASEIVSGALQDAKRGQLIGDTTFGTGTVLNEFPLSDGSALLLATQEWLTPSGRVIWHHGIVPDTKVDLPANGQLLVPEAEQTLTADQLKASTDAQLLKAVSVLGAPK